MTGDPRAEPPVPSRSTGGIRSPGARPRPVVEPSVVYEPPPPPRRLGGDPAMRQDLGLVLFVVAVLVIGVVTWNLAGAFTSEAFGPHPSASGAALASATPRATSAPSGGSPSASPSEAPSAPPSPTPTPKPVRKPVRMQIEPDPAAHFASEAKDTWCAAAAVQIALNVNGPDGRIDTSRARQAAIHALEVQLTTQRDSHNGGAGPLGMVATLERLGKVDYELRIYRSRATALRAAAKAIGETRHAAILLAWRGAHAWVMTGFRANADPTVFADARVAGAYIIDPWYPRVSSIWGPSDRPGVYQDGSEMVRNYLPWRRPDGRYPGRDGRFLVILPTS